MRRQLIITATAAVLALSTAAGLDAQRGSGRRGPDSGPVAAPQQPAETRSDGDRGPGGPGRGRGGFMPGVNLTDEQRPKVEAILRSTRDQAAPIADQLALARKTLNREAFADKRDNGKIASLTNNVANLEKQLLEVRTKANAAIADLLTPDQREVARANGGFDAGGPMRVGGPVRAGGSPMRPGAGRGRGMRMGGAQN
jgi:Spy/CpxP family protein refolding chaperone